MNKTTRVFKMNLSSLGYQSLLLDDLDSGPVTPDNKICTTWWRLSWGIPVEKYFTIQVWPDNDWASLWRKKTKPLRVLKNCSNHLHRCFYCQWFDLSVKVSQGHEDQSTALLSSSSHELEDKWNKIRYHMCLKWKWNHFLMNIWKILIEVKWVASDVHLIYSYLLVRRGLCEFMSWF